MSIESAIPALGAAGTLSLVAMKAPDLLKEIYGDLAKPGVQQVGKALHTVLQLGSNILLPLRLLNETARAFEQKSFSAIADRFSKIEEDNVIQVSPEIGVPIMEALSRTSDDTLRHLFVELLAKASNKTQVWAVHPSFVNIISSLSPDEALLIQSFRGKQHIPMVSLDMVTPADNSATTLADFIIEPTSGLTYPDRVPLYLSNFNGLGLIEIRRDTWITEPGMYNSVEQQALSRFPGQSVIILGTEERPLVAKKHVLVILPYGQAFITACV